MTALAIVGMIYVIGLIASLVLVFKAAGNETTAHGQEIILVVGLLLALGWPATLLWGAVVALLSGISWAYRRLRGQP